VSDLAVADLPRSIPALAERAATRYGSAEGVVDGDIRLSFAEVAAAGRQAARSFIASGIEPGDRVAIWAPNMHEWIVALLGLQSAGAVLVPLNTRFKGAEAAYILRKSRARMLMTVSGFLDTDYPALLEGEKLPDLEEIVVLRDASWKEFLTRGDAKGVTDDEVTARVAAIDPDDVSDILFTSGTTGMPKGVMCTHGQTLRAYDAWADVVGLREGDRYLIVNPFFHAFGYKAGLVASLLKGATIVPHAVFDPATVLARVPEERITMLPGPPALYQTILNSPELAKHDISSLRLAVTGAAAIPVELILRMRKELTFENIVTGYGLTEACGIATMCRHDDDPETIAKTSGRAIPGVEVKLARDGELLVRGYNVMSGYFEDPDGTAEAIDSDGWLHTGDIAEMDDGSNVRITDRKKDMFIVGGFNAYPAEIENLMLGDDRIAQVAVVGVPDERLGEVGVAFVVPRSDFEPTAETADEIVAWCRDHMANYKVPRRVVLVDALPLNASGKVLKYQLRERAQA
jgi:acyl-CoA synthetase (AMP-forming)/AMP-acid ligase II